MNIVTLTGDVKVLKKSSNSVIIHLKPKNRVLVTKDNIVSSLSGSDIHNIYEQLKKSSMCVFSLENGSNQKVATLDKVRVVKINNKDILKLWISSDHYIKEGSFAKKAVNLQDSADGIMVFWIDFRPRGPYEGAVLRNQNFTGRNLEGAIFRGSVITDSDFTGANLTNAVFRGSDLRGSDFTRANLTNADFRGSNFRNAISTNAITTGARFEYNINDNDLF